MVTTARAADSLNSCVAGSSPGSVTVNPNPPCRADSVRATARPPSLRSWAECSSRSRAASRITLASPASARRSTCGGVPPRCPLCTASAQTDPDSSSLVVPSSQIPSPAFAKPDRTRLDTSSITPSTPTVGVGRIGVPPVWL